MSLQFRQGDVFVERIDEPPEIVGASVERENGRVILAYGEATGHAHAILEDDVSFFALPGTRDRLLVVGAVDARLVHEEHATIELPPGYYVVRRQVEYTPGAVRRVQD